MCRRSLFPLRIAVTVLVALPAAGGPPPDTCRPPLDPDCPFQSDLIVFRLNDPGGYEVTAHIARCDLCAPEGPDIRFRGEIQVRFGPYDPAITLCPLGTDLYRFTVDPPSLFRFAEGVGEDSKYVPSDPSQVFPRDDGQLPLRTACVSDANLDYSIPDFALIGSLGARTPSFDPPILTLPSVVRGIEDDGSLASTNDLATPFSFKESVEFATTESKAFGSPFRFWPEGLPFRLGPDSVTYEHNRVSFTTSGPPVGPTPYESTPPETGEQETNIPDNVLITCAGTGCTTSVTYNGGYFAAAWTPSGTSFDIDGLDATLTLPSTAAPVTYEPAFPRGLRLTLEAPANLVLADGAIQSGGFDGGQVGLEYDALVKYDGVCEGGPNPGDHCQEDTDCGSGGTCNLDADYCFVDSLVYDFTLRGSPDPAPELMANGGLQAGVVGLNPDDLPIVWTFNEAHDLGCGTLWVPPVVNDRGPPGPPASPQSSWLSSAALPADGRGLYAGVNYNRDGVCEGGADDGALCQSDADCDGSCNLGRFSPLCDVLGSRTPTWVSRVDSGKVLSAIVPGAVGQEDREMVFFARGSGVTGVFDAGEVNAQIGDPLGLPPTFDVDFDRYGLAFLDSDSGPDTLVRGAAHLPWPSETDLPFDRLSLCNCGQLEQAEVPEELVTRVLGYWDAQFDPYALDFQNDAAGDCLAAPLCEGENPAAKVCVSAITPVPHFWPKPESRVGLLPQGNHDGDGIRPSSTANMQFERSTLGAAAHPPYPFHAETFLLSDWDPECDSSEVGDPGNAECPYGFYDAKGRVVLPYFGASAAMIRVQKRKDTGLRAVDLHSAVTEDSFISLGRKIAGDALDLAFNVDYFQPSTTRDDDGQDGVDPADRTLALGRGIFLGFARDGGLDLGALPVGAGLVIDPGRPDAELASDLGPTGAMRLWGNVIGAGQGQLADVLDDGSNDRLTDDLKAAYDEALDLIDGTADGVADWLGRDIPAPDEDFDDLMHTSGALDAFDLCQSVDFCPESPDFLAEFNVGDADLSPKTLARRFTGHLRFSDPEMPDLARVDGDMLSLADDGQAFFAFARGQLDVQRFVREAEAAGEQAITQLGREIGAGNIKLPGKQDIAFPDLAGIPGLSWDFDYDAPPAFRFNSLTGSLDLTQGGLSGLGFEELGATLKFYGDGDWYFQADADIDFPQAAGAEGHLLLGSTRNMDPLYDLDPEVADFLGEIPKFDGAFLSVGVRRNWVDMGCVLRIRTGAEVGGWYLRKADSFGGKLEGWVDGRGACLVSVKGEVSMIGGTVGDLYKLRGDLWVGGGLGWDCDEGSWDSAREALRDGGCFVCVASVGCQLTYPESDLSCNRPDYTCR